MKSSMIISSILGSLVMLSGRGRRVSAMMDVIFGSSRHWARTSLPMKPVTPVRMTFMFGLSGLGGFKIVEM